MKKMIMNVALLAAMTGVSATAAAQPAGSATVPPEFAASKLRAVYSDAYPSAVGFGFGEWGSGTTYAEDKISGTDDNVAKFTTTDRGYFGLELRSDINAVALDKLHIDVWSDVDTSIDICPICRQHKNDAPQKLQLKAGQWNSFDLDTKVWEDAGNNIAGVFQLKFANMPNNTVWLDNIYFYSTSTDVDTEAPANFSASLKETTYASIVLTCQATDNSGALEFVVTDSSKGVEVRQGAASGEATEVTVGGLLSGTEYNLTVKAVDLDGNESSSQVIVARTKGISAPAPTPAVKQEDVVSVFSDAYQPASAFNIGGWGQSTVYSTFKIGGTDEVMNLEKFNHLGLEFNSHFSVAEMEYLHIDVYVESANAFGITPISPGPKERLFWVSNLKVGEWNSIDIPMSEFSVVDFNDIFQIKMTAESAGTAVVLVDNIYFYREAFVLDEEAPVWAAEPFAKTVAPTSAVLAVKADDNLSKNLTYEASAAADFSAIAATVDAAKGVEAELNLSGLQSSTDYTYYVRVKDAQGNVSAVKTVSFITKAGDAVVATFYGRFETSDWEEKGKKDGVEVIPAIDWKAETTADLNVIVTAKLSEALPEGVVPKFCGFVEGGIGALDNLDMTPTNVPNEYSISLKERLPEGKSFVEGQIFGQFFFRIYPGEGVSRTKILAAHYKVGASNEPPVADVEAPTWAAEPACGDVTDRSATIRVAVKDNSGSAVVTVSANNGFNPVVKTVKADGSEQTIELTGLVPSTPYVVTLAVVDAAGNPAAEEKTLSFTTLEEMALDVLYVRIPMAAEDWNSTSEVPYRPTGDILISVLADNRLKFTVTLGEDRTDFIETLLYIHGFEEGVKLEKVADNTYEYTTVKSVTDRNAQMFFHMYFVYQGGTSTFAAKPFVPGDGSTSGVCSLGADTLWKAYGSHGVLRIEGVAGKQVAVYALSGKAVFSAEAVEEVVDVELPQGVYIVVVENKAMKVVL